MIKMIHHRKLSEMTEEERNFFVDEALSPIRHSLVELTDEEFIIEMVDTVEIEGEEVEVTDEVTFSMTGRIYCDFYQPNLKYLWAQFLAARGFDHIFEDNPFL